MSAFIVSEAHINALVETAFSGPSDRAAKYAGDGWIRPSWNVGEPVTYDEYQHSHRCADFDQLERIGEMLMLECVRSVSYRYDDCDDLPGPVDRYWERPYAHRRTMRPTAVEMLKAISCYEYQSCERPEWRASEAFAFCQALRHSLIGCLPGYDDAAWELEAEMAR